MLYWMQKFMKILLRFSEILIKFWQNFAKIKSQAPAWIAEAAEDRQVPSEEMQRIYGPSKEGDFDYGGRGLA